MQWVRKWALDFIFFAGILGPCCSNEDQVPTGLASQRSTVEMPTLGTQPGLTRSEFGFSQNPDIHTGVEALLSVSGSQGPVPTSSSSSRGLGRTAHSQAPLLNEKRWGWRLAICVSGPAVRDAR